MYFKINNNDFSGLVSSMKIGYETLVSDESGRNAAGDMTFTYLNRKIKVYITFRHMTDKEMNMLMSQLDPREEIMVTFRSPETGQLQTISTYTGTPEPEYYTIQPTMVVYKPMSLNFIER